MSTDDLSSARAPLDNLSSTSDGLPSTTDAATDPVLPPGTGAVRYAYYLRETRAQNGGVAAIPVVLMITAFAAFLVAGPSETSAVVLLAALALLGSWRIFLRQPRHEVGVALTDTHVVLGRFPSDTRTIARERVVSCVVSDRPWLGGEVPPAAASFLVMKLRYLTITDDDGVAYNVAFDAANPWADHICDVLGGKSELRTPTELAGVRKRPPAETAPRPKPARAVPADPAPERPAPTRSEASPDAERRLWEAAMERHDEILRAYFPYESDPHLVLTYPAVSDVTVPETATFFDSLAEATALRTETYPGESVAVAYRDVVKTLAAAWAAAERNAKRAGTSLLDPPDRRRLDQAAKLLRHADSATSPHERASYLRQVKSIVDDLIATGAITAPPRAMMEIERATARAIEAAGLS